MCGYSASTSLFMDLWPLKMKAMPCFKIRATTYPAVQHHIPEHGNPRLHFCENLKNSPLFVTAVYKENNWYYFNLFARIGHKVALLMKSVKSATPWKVLYLGRQCS
jgi:hypothetical protein